MALSRIKIPFDIIIVLIVLAVNGFVIFAPANSLMNWYSTDDAFYYFKTAQNIAEGKGITFDGIGRANGFHPLWMLVCIPVFALARFDLLLPLRLLALISILLHAFCGVLIFRILKRLISPAASMLASVLWLFSMIIHHTTAQLGMESGINAFFTLLFLDSVSQGELDGHWDRQRIFRLGALAALVLFSRLDNVFLVFMFGLWVLLRHSALRNLLAWDMLLAAVSALCAFYAVVGFYESLRPYMPSAGLMVALAITLRPLVYFLFGLYGKPNSPGRGKSWLSACAASLTASVTIGAFMLAAFSARLFTALPRSALLLDGGLALALTLGLRWVYQCLCGNKDLLPPSNQGTPFQLLRRNLSTWLAEGIRYALPAAVGLVIYMGWNKLYFGTFMPVSGQIKHWWGSIYTAYGRPVATLQEFLGFPQDIRQSPWHLALSLPAALARRAHPLLNALNIDSNKTGLVLMAVILLGLSLFILAQRWRYYRAAIARMGLVPLAATCAAQVIYYHGSNYVGLRNWYWVSQLIFTILISGLLLDGLMYTLSRLKIPHQVLHISTFLLAGCLLASFTRSLLQLVPPRAKFEHTDAYLADIRALEAATEPGALIGSTGGGVVAYFIQNRTVINLDGLMNTAQYFELMKTGNAHIYLNQIGLDYIYSNAYIVTHTEPFEEIFATRTALIGELGDGTLFRYIPNP